MKHWSTYISDQAPSTCQKRMLLWYPMSHKAGKRRNHLLITYIATQGGWLLSDALKYQCFFRAAADRHPPYVVYWSMLYLEILIGHNCKKIRCGKFEFCISEVHDFTNNFSTWEKTFWLHFVCKNQLIKSQPHQNINVKLFL